MKIYLVGGAVRDKLLGLPIKEKDWVVVGGTVEEMLKNGFRPVGKDFPVFLHPETQEEYALARTERKIGRGYTGFNFNTSPDVTVEEDLKRRDLTINAMAETFPDGMLIDPYQGQEDLKHKILRHVSPAFVEDPVRILRIARFAARFSDFCVAPETLALMKQMVASGEVDALVAERVWKELERALSEMHPEKFFQVLQESHALPKLFPVIDIKAMDALRSAAQVSVDKQVRFAAVLYAVPENEIKSLCERFRVPSDYRELAILVSRHLSDTKDINAAKADKIIELLQSIDAFRREERFFKFLFVCKSVEANFPVNDWIVYLNIAKQINVKELIAKGFSNQALAEEIKKERIRKLGEYFKK